MHDLFMHGENIKMNDNDENDNDYDGDGDDNDNKNDEIFHRSVRSILDQLVKHFRQNIHSDLEENSPTMIVPSNKNNDDDNNDSRVYESNGSINDGDNNELPRELSPIIRYWLDQLWSIAVQQQQQQQQQVGTTDTTTTTNNKDNDNTAIEVEVIMVVSEWIKGYETSIRSIIFDTNGTNHHRTATANTILVPPFNPGCISVLKNYELVLSEILLRLLDLVAARDDDDNNNNDRNDDNNDNSNNNNNNNSNNITKSGTIVIKSSTSSLIATSSSSSSSSSSPAASSSLKRSLSRTINIISSDVTILTAAKNNEDNEDDNKNKNKNLRRNVALPMLLKILSDTLTTFDQVCVVLDNNKNINSDENTSINNDNNGVNNCLLEYYDCFRRCAVTLLAFDDGSSNNNNKNEKDGNSATSSLNVLSPHHLSPSLSLPISTSASLMTPSSSVNVHKNDNLDIVQRMIKRLQDCRGDSSSKSDDDDDDDGDGDDDLCQSYSYLDDNYWDSYSKSYLSTQGWIDPNNTKYVSQLVDDIWNKMLSLLLLNRRQVEEVRQSKLLQRKSVLKILGGASPLLRDVRAHFFGRDMHGVEELLTQQQQEETVSASSVVIRMGRRVVNTTTKKHTSRSNSNDDPPYQMIPSRIAVAVNALRLLLTPDMTLLEQNDYQDDVVDVSSYGYRIIREKILEDVFPICASLVDSTNTTYSTLGAAGFLLVTDVLLQSQLKDTTIHDVVDDDRRKILKCNNNDGNNNNNNNDNALLNFMENTLSVLERAFQSSEGHGPVVVTIGRAQSKLFEIMLRRKEKNEDCHYDDHVRRRRRTVTGHWLTRLEKSSYRPTSEEQCLELLLGGILPLLSQHAIDRNNEADAIEVGRMGLAALLPLTTMTTTDGMGELWGDETTRKTQMASMVALINLMFAAHLIMPCHGGKIMSNLLAAAATATPITNGNKNDGWSEEKSPKTPTAASIRSMAVLTAAIALNICGPKFAGELVQSIEKDHEQYQQNILTVVSEVCKLAGDLTVREQI